VSFKALSSTLLHLPLLQSGFLIRIQLGSGSGTGSGFNQVSGSGFGSVFGIPIRIQEGKNDHKSIQKFRNFMFLSAGCSFLRAEGFFCNLDFLIGIG
jgi:hypothetical protein